MNDFSEGYKKDYFKNFTTSLSGNRNFCKIFTKMRYVWKKSAENMSK